MEEARKVNQMFNIVFNKNYKAINFSKNLHEWRQVYTLDEIAQAIARAKHLSSDFYQNMTPTLLTRTRNTNGTADYIGDILNTTLQDQQLALAKRDYEKIKDLV